MTLHDHGGLAADLPRLLSRRRALGLAGGLAAVLSGCGGDGEPAATEAGIPPAAPPASSPRATPPSGGPGGAPPVSAGSDVVAGAGKIPTETGGPFPGDGSNGPDALTGTGVVRKDIRTSFGAAGGTAAGVPLTVRLTVVELDDGRSTPLEGAAIYVWHCDREGRYSMYEEPVVDENYLRGVQAADADGVVEFTSIFPAAYGGRWPHLHLEVYRDLATATSAGDKLRTTQLALPEDVCTIVFASEGYQASAANMTQLSLATDVAFSDGYALQMAKLTGSVEDGYTASLTVPV